MFVRLPSSFNFGLFCKILLSVITNHNFENPYLTRLASLLTEAIIKSWPIFLGIITLIIVLAKMHGDIEILKEKVKTLFDLWNKNNG